MPNWCSTSYYVYGNDKMEILRFFMDVKLAMEIGKEEKKDPACFGSEWLGNIYLQAGCKRTADDAEWKDGWIECRGSVEHFELDLDVDKTPKGVLLRCETAWDPMNGSFERMLREHYPGLEMVCEAEEYGCDLYYNDDVDHRYFTEKWILETQDGDCEYYGYDEEKRLLADIEELTGLKYDSADDVDEDEMQEAYWKKSPDTEKEDVRIWFKTFMC